jgi:NADH-quinone oxidoreductase subunit J
MTFPIHQVVFYVFASVLIAAALAVIFSRNPVQSILFLVLSFFAAAVLWMLMQAEFLSLVLIFVYVGAVMTLFLFVVMMLHVDLKELKEKFVRFLPFALLVMIALIAAMVFVLSPKHFGLGLTLPTHYGANYSNTTAMGTLLFTKYLYPFEIAAAILLVAIIAAIALAFHGRKLGTKSQNIATQHEASKTDRLVILKDVDERGLKRGKQ